MDNYHFNFDVQNYNDFCNQIFGLVLSCLTHHVSFKFSPTLSGCHVELFGSERDQDACFHLFEELLKIPFSHIDRQNNNFV